MAPRMVEQEENHAFSEARFSLPLRKELPDDASFPKQRRRRVKFGERSITELHDEVEHTEKWWTADELQRIRREAKALSGDLRSKGNANTSSCFLSLAHRKTTLMLSADFKSLTKLSKSTPDQDLHQWCSWNDGRRGLERFSSQTYWVFRRRDIAYFREGVVKTSKRLRQDGDYDPEAIAKLAREASRRPRTFALFMGEADALEANSVYTDVSPMTRQAPPRKRGRMVH